MIYPYKLETPFTRYPYTNAAIIAFTSIFHFLVMLGIVPYETSESMVLQEWNMVQMIGNVFLHANIVHLVGNMIFLWMFGNAVCALIGNLSYFFVYVFLGICASAAQLYSDGVPAIGASGAINGIIGVAFIYFPVNKVHSRYLLSWPFSFPDIIKWGTVSVKAFWMILLWFVWDILGLAGGEDGIGHWAHLGGFAAGALTGLLMLKADMFETYEATIMDLISGNVPAVERDIMNIEQLEREQEQRKRAEERERKRESELETPAEPPDVAGPPAFQDAFPLFRVLKVGRKDGDVFCYFINEGDKISNAVVRSAYAAEIQPSLLDKKAPGWIRFTTHNDINLEQLQLDLSFDAGVNRLNKQMKFDPAGKKFFVV